MTLQDVRATNQGIEGYVIVEDCVQVRSQTLYDPPEYGPARCRLAVSYAILPLNKQDYVSMDTEQLEDVLSEYAEMESCWTVCED